MPWQEQSPMDLRQQFIHDYASGRFTVTELADTYRISRKTGHKWIARHHEGGRAALADRSRRPHASPSATPQVIVAALCEARRKHPTWSAPKLLAWLAARHPRMPWPASSTAGGLLRAAGLVRQRRRRRGPCARLTPPLPVALEPNDLWTIDYKGEFRTGDAAMCYPLTLRDGYSRLVLRIDALPAITATDTRARLTSAFGEYGLPRRIRSDNGTPFASTGLGGLSRLSVWWLQLGIVPERIWPRHPEQNGAHEQFHAVLKRDTARPPAASLRAQQRRFDHFREEYNVERPHQAWGQRPPATHYRRSPRRLPARPCGFEYPGHFDVRRVGSNGCAVWRQRPLFLGHAMAGHDLGFEEIADAVWRIQIGPLTIAHFNASTRVVTELPW
jgi:putative transposase